MAVSWMHQTVPKTFVEWGEKQHLPCSAPAQDGGIRLSWHRSSWRCPSRHPAHRLLWAAAVAVPSAQTPLFWCPGLTHTPAFWQRGAGRPFRCAAEARSHIWQPSPALPLSALSYFPARHHRCWRSEGSVPRGIPGCCSGARHRTARAPVSSRHEKL